MQCWKPQSPTANVDDEVRAFYEGHPYPAPLDDLEAYGKTWDSARRRAESHLLFPAQPYRGDRSVLVAGCGTVQAAHYALRWPSARVVGIDVSASSIAFTEQLKRKYALDNLEVRELPVERAAELEESFELVVCTGVLHHLADPDAGLRALRQVLAPDGAMHIMLYAPYGRAGIYMIQDYCKRLGIGRTAAEIRDLAASLKALPPDHPLVPLLRNSPDFATMDGLADALLHPRDRSYSVPELMEFIERADLVFARWIRQAPYLPGCGAFASSPHAAKVAALPPKEQCAAIELFRGTMARHSFIAHRREQRRFVNFEDDEWIDYVPIRLPETLIIKEQLPAGATAVLINRRHAYTDLYLPIDAQRERLFLAIDDEHSIAGIAANVNDRTVARAFFKQLWLWDQVVFDISRGTAADFG